ncbi:MAG: hypothetical protein ACI90V_005606 [Bacillariaceae sp.]|jgi:hypothetical protein
MTLSDAIYAFKWMCHDFTPSPKIKEIDARLNYSLSKGDQDDKLWIDVFEHTSLKCFIQI